MDIDVNKGLKRFTVTKKKRGGIQDPLTEARVSTAEMLGITIGHLGKLTKGWTVDQVYRLEKECRGFIANPQALWWKKYKTLKNIYGKNKNKTTNKKDVQRVGQESGRDQQEKGARLF